MASPSKPVLRGTLRKLRAAAAVPADDAALAAQDFLDFLAVRARYKPVQMLARDGGPWTGAILQAAADAGLKVIDGPQWRVGSHDGLPDWLRDHVSDAVARTRNAYVCRDSRTVREVSEICAAGTATIAREAHLLDYPECCVRAHHERSARYFGLLLATLRRAAGDDDRRAAAMLAAGAAPRAETPEEREALREIVSPAEVPFASFLACARCAAAGPDSPAGRKSRQAGALARAVDPDLFAALRPPGRTCDLPAAHA